MKTAIRKTALLVAAIVWLCGGLPAAEGWFAGVEFGYVRCIFRPYYTVMSPGETPAQYVDRGNGAEVGVVFGREWRVGSWFMIGAQGRASVTNAKWEADFSGEETSHIEYKMGGAFALSILPAIRLRPGLWIKGEAGGGVSRVREHKTSVDYTSYHFDEWVACYLVGAGLCYELTRCIELTANYRYRQTRAFTYKAYLPDGRHWETITDKPSSHTVTGGIRFRF